MANTNFVHFLKQKFCKRKLQEVEFYDDLQTFFASQTIEEEVVALILYRLVEQYDRNKPKKISNKCRTGTATTKNHFGTPDI